jgi:hypothetical protein
MNLINVAIFTFPSEAAILESILSAENIPYFLNNPNLAIIIPGSGTTISVKEEDLEKAIKVIKAAGFERYLLERDK